MNRMATKFQPTRIANKNYSQLGTCWQSQCKINVKMHDNNCFCDPYKLLLYKFNTNITIIKTNDHTNYRGFQLNIWLHLAKNNRNRHFPNLRVLLLVPNTACNVSQEIDNNSKGMNHIQLVVNIITIQMTKKNKSTFYETYSCNIINTYISTFSSTVKAT